MLCSIIIPTRGRVKQLSDCIESIAYNAGDLSYEIILRVDCDDIETLGALPSLINDFEAYAVVRVRCGYDRLNIAHDQAIRLAAGDWLWMMNDDVIVKGPWFDALSKIECPKSKALTRIIVYPEVHQLNQSVYRHDTANPFMLIPRWVWPSIYANMKTPVVDSEVNEQLKRRNWRPVFLEGVTTHHVCGGSESRPK